MTPTPEQLNKIANKLRGTRNNVYRVAESILGHEVGEEIFDQLRTVSLFKCELCDEWLDLAHETARDVCAHCMDGEDE